MVTTAFMPAPVWTNVYGAGVEGQGCYESVIAPTDSQRLYITFIDTVYRSDNQGATWTALDFPTDALFFSINYSNGAQRAFNKKMAIDPANPDVIIVSCPSHGVSISQNKGV